MAVVALTSVSGSPGVTTTALGLALHWPRPVLLVDADPVGASPILTGYLKGQVRHPGTLVELWMAHRTGRLGAALRELPVRLAENVDFVPGPAGTAQAESLGELWPHLAREFQELSRLGVDVVIDLGRLGHRLFPAALFQGADEALVVLRNDLVALGAAGTMPDLEREVGLVLIGDKPYAPRTVSDVVGHRVRHTLPLAVEQASIFSHGRPATKRWGRAPQGLQRGFKQGAEALVWRSDLDEEEIPA